MEFIIIAALAFAVLIAFLASKKRKSSTTPTYGGGWTGSDVQDEIKLPQDEMVESVAMELAPESTPAPEVVEAIKTVKKTVKKKAVAKKPTTKKSVAKKAPAKKTNKK